MDEATVTPQHCDCLNKLDAAADDCRRKATQNPGLETSYAQAALAIIRVARDHFKACPTCAAVESRTERAA
jgi:hypothetical protein